MNHVFIEPFLCHPDRLRHSRSSAVDSPSSKEIVKILVHERRRSHGRKEAGGQTSDLGGERPLPEVLLSAAVAAAAVDDESDTSSSSSLSCFCAASDWISSSESTHSEGRSECEAMEEPGREDGGEAEAARGGGGGGGGLSPRRPSASISFPFIRIACWKSCWSAGCPWRWRTGSPGYLGMWTGEHVVGLVAEGSCREPGPRRGRWPQGRTRSRLSLKRRG